MKRLWLVVVMLVVACESAEPGVPDPQGGPSAAAANTELQGSADIQNSNWQLTGVSDLVVPTTGDGSARVFFGLSDAFNSVSVNGPCDKLAGKYHSEGFSLKIIELAPTTTNTCSADATAAQAALTDAMLGAASLSISAEDKLTITGTATLTFDRVPR